MVMLQLAQIRVTLKPHSSRFDGTRPDQQQQMSGLTNVALLQLWLTTVYLCLKQLLRAFLYFKYAFHSSGPEPQRRKLATWEPRHGMHYQESGQVTIWTAPED